MRKSFFLGLTLSVISQLIASGAPTINETQTPPSLIITQTQANAGCDGGTPSGSLMVTVVNDDGNTYDIQWILGGTDLVDGTDPGNGSVPANAAPTDEGSTSTVTGLVGDSYTVKVTVADNGGSLSEGAYAIATFVLADDARDITATMVANDISNCTDIASSTVTIVSVEEDATDLTGTYNYTYTYYDNSSSGTPLIDADNTDGTLTGLDAGTHYVVITNTTTKCESGSISFDIADNTVLPQLSIAVTHNNTDCTGAANGILTVTVDNAASLGGTYNYTWYNGSDLDNESSIIDATTSTAATSDATTSGLAAGDYWVKVTDDDNTGICVAKISATIIDDPAEITIDDLTITYSDQCTFGVGTVQVDQMTFNGITTTDVTVLNNFTFNLYDDTGTYIKNFELQANPGLPTATNLPGGTYLIRAIENTGTACPSNAKQFQITEDLTRPTLTVNENANEACSGGIANGDLTVAIGNGDGSETFSFQWYVGNGTATPLIEGGDEGGTGSVTTNVTSATVSGLFADTYTVEVTVIGVGTGPLSLGCSATAVFTLTDDPLTITYDEAVAITNNISDCTGTATGSFGLNGSELEDGIDLSGTYTYNYAFYENSGTGIQALSATDNMSGLAAGSYYVVITNTTTNCESGSLSFDIRDVTVLPQLSIAVAAENTDCTGVSPNGILTVTVDNAADLGGTYNYTWYNGSDVADESSVTGDATASTVTTTNSTTSGLTAGDYWVKVTDNDNTGTCVAKISATIIDAPAQITTSDITLTHATDCSNAQNGQVLINEITVNGVAVNTETDLANYTFSLYDEHGVTEIAGAFTQGVAATSFPSADDLDAGTYYVFVTENGATACPSALLEITIENHTVTPILTIAEEAQNTQCGSSVNGSASVTITNDDTEDYTYQWYVGNDMNDTGNPVPSAGNLGNTATIVNMDEGFYWVLVTDNESKATGGTTNGLECSSRASVEITTNVPTITIEAADATIVDGSSCDTDNGQVTVAEVTVDGVGMGNTTDYTFKWYETDGTEVSGAVTADTRSDLPAGTYTIIAVNSVSECQSAPTSFTVDDISTLPMVTDNIVVTNSTSCDITNFQNGEISIAPDAYGTPDDGTYTYTWFDHAASDIGTGSENIISGPLTNNSTLSSLVPDTYTVMVETNSSGCTTALQLSLEQGTTTDPNIIGVVNGTLVTNCTLPDGVVTAAEAAGDPTLYNWHWYEDEEGKVTMGTEVTSAVVNNNIVTGLDERTYSVNIENKVTGCISPLSTVEVTREAAADIIINIFDTQPGSCNGATGRLRIEASEPSASTFTFEVYRGESDLAASSDLVASSTGDGSDDTGVTDNDNVSYATETNDDDDNGTDYEVDGLINDTYTVVATDLATGCTERRVYVLYWADVQRVDVDPIVINHAENCLPYATGGMAGTGGNTGEADIVLRIPSTNPNDHGDYQLFLFEGTDIDPQPDMLIGGGEWSVGDGRSLMIQAMAGLDDGSVTIDTDNPDMKISGYTGTFLNGQTLLGATSGATATVDTDDSSGNLVFSIVSGEFEIGEIVNSSSGAAINAIVDDYQNNGFLDAVRTYSFTGLAAGNYAVVAAQEATGFCYSPPVTFVIEDHTDDIVIDESTDVTIVNNEDCSGTSVNGSGSITIDEITRGADTQSTATAINSAYDFVWYEGSINASNIIGTNFGTVSADGNAVTGLPAGSYLVEITKVNPGADDDDEDCTTSYTYDVFDAIPNLTVEDATSTDATDCATLGNGEITIGNVDVGSGTEAFTTVNATYDFFVYESGNNTPVNTGDVDDGTVTGLAVGTYFVTIQNEATLCESDPFTVTIEDGHADPDLAAGVVIGTNTGCDGLTDGRTGTVTVTLDDDVANYTISWWIGDVDSGIAVAGVNTNNHGNDAEIINLGGGTYALEVVDNSNPDNGCSSFAEYNIPDNINNITAAVNTSANAEDCTDPNNGSITFSSITQDSGTVTDGATIDANFAFYLYDENFTAPPTTNAREITGLSVGTYYVVVENNTTKCQLDPVHFTISDDSNLPALSIAIDSDNTACDESTGEVTLIIDNDDGSTYDIEWFVGSDVSDEGQPFVDATSPTDQTAGTGTLNPSGISSGDYWVKVTDTAHPSNGCSTKLAFSIEENLADISIAMADITITESSDCSGTNLTGSIEVTDVTVDGAAIGSVTGYSFEFFEDSYLSVSTTNVYSSVAPGNYFVVATNTTSGCESAPVQITVGDSSYNPDLDISVANVTSCDTDNGSITVRINDPDHPADYLDPNDFTFTWYYGSQVKFPNRFVNAVAGSNSLSALAAGQYTVEVNSVVVPGLACNTIVTITVDDDLPVLEITTATPSDILDCTGDGQIEITAFEVDGVAVSSKSYVNYGFSIYDNSAIFLSVFNNAPTGTGNPIQDGLDAGTYYISVEQNASGCTSDLVEMVIGDQSVNPDISIAITTQNSTCDDTAGSGNYNGVLTVVVDNAVDTNYNYEWHAGSDINTNNPIGQTTAIASGLQEGFYWVEVTDNDPDGNGCTAKAVIELTTDYDDITIAIADITITDASDCSGANHTGSIEVTDIKVDGAAIGSVAGYSFEFFDDSYTSLSTINPYTSIAPGNYFVVATNTTSGCESAPTQITVGDSSYNPDLDISAVTNVTSCDADNGSITVQINDPDAPAGYLDINDFTFTWYYGSQPKVANIFVDAVVGHNTISTLAAGQYTVLANSNVVPGLACNTIVTITVDNDLPVLDITNATPSDILDCNGQGQIEITAFEINGIPIAQSSSINYDFTLYDCDAANPVAFNNSPNGIDNPIHDGLAAGAYYISVEQTASGCVSELLQVVIEDHAVVPDIQLVLTDEDLHCTSGGINGSGGITVSVDESGTPNISTDYTFTWYRGGGTTTPLTGGTSTLTQNNTTVSGLSDATYTVVVVDNNGANGNLACSSTAEIIVPQTSGNCLSENTDIISFSFPGQIGPAIIDGTNHTVSIDMVFGTDFSALVSTFTLSTGANIEVGNTVQVSGTTANDFTNPVTYTITAQDAITTQNWLVTVEVVSDKWSGLVDTNWGNAGNWIGNKVPASSGMVIIPATTNNPVITADVEIYSIHVEESASLIISTNSLKVNNTITLDGNLVVASGASLVPLGAISGAGIATIHRNTTFGVSDGKYSVIGSPITLGSTSSLGNIVYSYDETIAYDAGGTAGGARFVSVGSSELMDKGDAYFSANTGDISFSGIPNSGDIDVPLVYDEVNDGGTINAGFNLVSNPYTAAINFTDFVNGNPQMNGSIYIWDDGGSNSASRTNSDYIVANNLGIVGGSGRSGSVDGYIRSTQGFFVKATSAGILHFTPSMMATNSNSDAGYFREEKPSVLKFSLSSEHSRSAILVGFLDQATPYFDRSFDAYKFKGNNLLQLSSKMGPSLMAIQGLPLSAEETEVDLEVDIAKAGSYTIKLENTSAFGFGVYLEDHLLNKLIDLSLSNSYSFESFAVNNSDRFSLVFSPQIVLGIDHKLEANEMLIFANDAILNVRINEVIADATVCIYNLSGIKLKEIKKVDFEGVDWKTSFTERGIFVLTVKSERQLYIKKFFKE